MTRVMSAPAPEVSVVVIFKDAEDFVEEAIESVRAQTLRRWELLLVDDGSTDKSTPITRRYVEEGGGRVRYLEHTEHANLGMSASRNLGVSQSRGEFVAFLDADDVLVPTALEHQVALLHAHPRVGMVYGPLEYWYGWTGLREDEARDFIHPVGLPSERIYEPPTLISLFIQNTGFAPSGMLLRRAVVEEVGGFEESFRDLYEDQVFAAKICRTTPVYVSGRRTYRYRQHPSSSCLTAQREGRLASSRGPFLRWLVGYLEEEGLTGSDPWRRALSELAVQRRRSLFRLASRRMVMARRLAALLGGSGGAGR